MAISTTRTDSTKATAARCASSPRELTLVAGFALDWTGSGVGTEERNALYVARDVAVLERAFPGLTEDRAMSTDDRAEYEAFYVLERLRQEMGENSLAAIIREGLTIGQSMEQKQERDRAAEEQAY